MLLVTVLLTVLLNRGREGEVVDVDFGSDCCAVVDAMHVNAETGEVVLLFKLISLVSLWTTESDVIMRDTEHDIVSGVDRTSTL